MLKTITTVVATLAVAGIACGQDAVQWTEAEGGNGHWYELREGTGSNWNDHRETALAVGGDLACPIDENTNTFLADLMLASPLCGDVTYISIGGLQSQGEDEPDGGWQWVSGAEWSWTNWSSDEPNDAWDGEWALVYNSSPTCGDLWNDVNPTLDNLNRGYIIEWSADCNGDGIVDYGQILDGSLNDDDGNGVPDCCDDTSCLTGVQWKVEDGGNGHWYQAVNPGPTTWADSRSSALDLGGDLTSMETDEEIIWVFNTIASNPSLWYYNASENDGPYIGGFQDTNAPDYEEPGGGWYWLTGTPLQTNYWGPGQPNYASQDHLHFWSPDASVSMTFDNVEDTDSSGGSSYIVEWSADCNGDGIVDYGQILDGSLEDLDGNGVPDCCDDTSCLAGVQWKVEDGGNGHWYGALKSETGLLWDASMQMAEEAGGYLLCLNSMDESDFIQSLLPTTFGLPDDPNYVMNIGLFRNDCDGAWEWVDGSIPMVVDWACDEPNGCPERQCVLVNKDCDDTGWKWADTPLEDQNEGHIIEWSADCNGDGIVDYGQILNGTLEDQDGNGIPDICECPADVTGDGAVDITDLLIVIGAWDSDYADADLDGDGVVGIADLLAVIDGWGFCP